jgi:hypothetical protein
MTDSRWKMADGGWEKADTLKEGGGGIGLRVGGVWRKES